MRLKAAEKNPPESTSNEKRCAYTKNEARVQMPNKKHNSSHDEYKRTQTKNWSVRPTQRHINALCERNSKYTVTFVFHPMEYIPLAPYFVGNISAICVCKHTKVTRCCNLKSTSLYASLLLLCAYYLLLLNPFSSHVYAWS